MNFLRLPYFILLLAFLVSPVWAQSWEGTWSTQFGQLKLVDLGDYVVGDYGSNGIIIGKKNFDLLQGVFTNSGQKKSGRFTFQSQPGNQFRGSYRWENSDKLSDWMGKKTSTKVESLSNFSLDGSAIQLYQNQRKDYDGVYGSPFGDLRLRQKNNILYGDYGKVGVLAGVWNGNGFEGRFTNNGRVGWFRFDFLSKTASFRSGRYGWLPVGKSSPWNLAKKTAGTPTLYQVHKPSGSNTASVQAENNTQNQNQNRPANNTNNRPPAKTYPAIAFPRSFDANYADCAVSQQEHVSYVSQPSTDDVANALSAAGWTLVGPVITSRVDDDPVLRMLTTDRLRAYVATRGNDIVVCFRGSKSSQTDDEETKWNARFKTVLNGGTDASAIPVKASCLFNNSYNAAQAQNVKVHLGFNRAYGRLRSEIVQRVGRLPNPKQKTLYIFGHSLGGAQATLCAMDFGANMNRRFKAIALMVSGCPRVGDVNFGRYFQQVIGVAHRIEIRGDIVTMLPPQRGRDNGYVYKHIGRLLALTNNGNLIEPEDITKRPVRDFQKGVHANTNYLRVVRSFHQKSGRAGFFNGRQNYLNRAGAAERKL